MKHLAFLTALLLLLPVCVPRGASGQAKTGYIQAGKYSLYYEETGKGEPLILIHAALLDRRMWDAQVPLFSRWARVIRFDGRNHGLSHGLPDSFAYCEDLNRVMEALGVQKARLVGCALGGATAVDFALVHPEKVSALVLVSPALSGYDFKDPVVLENQKKQSEAAARKDMNTFIEYFQRSWTDGPRRTPDQVSRDVRAKILQMCRATLSKPEPDNIALPLDPPAIGRLASIHIPTLVVCGDFDQAGVDEVAGLLVRGIPGARRVVIKGAGHMVNMEKPEEFNEIVGEFLSK